MHNKQGTQPFAPEQSIPTGVDDIDESLQLRIAQHEHELDENLQCEPDLEDDELVGVEIDKWRLSRQIGKGGMATVYEAEHTWLEQKAAIKLMLPAASGSPQSLERFQQEALLISRLNHPNIVEIKDFGEDPEYSSYMVMELLSGHDLSDLREYPDASLFRGWLLSLFEQLFAALDAIHSLQVIHRDLKPSNIFLVPGTPFPQVKLLDFGIAKVLEDAQEGNLTGTGIVLGTPNYLAPEQLKTRPKVTPATDIYAAGVILYEILAGRLPLLGEGPVEHILLVVQTVAPKLGQFRPELAGSKLEALLHSMLSKRGSDRPNSANEAWDLLQTALAELPQITPGTPCENPITMVPNTPTPNTPAPNTPDPINTPRPSNNLPARHHNPFNTTAEHQELHEAQAFLRTETLSELQQEPHENPPQVFEDPPDGPNKWRNILAFFALASLLGAGISWWYRSGTPSTPPDPVQPRVAKTPSRPVETPLQRQLGKAQRAWKQGKVNAAIRHWESAIQMPSWKSVQSGDVYAALAHAYARRGWLYPAIYYIKRARTIDNDKQRTKAWSNAQTRWQQQYDKRAQNIPVAFKRLQRHLERKRWLLASLAYQQLQRQVPATPQIQCRVAKQIGASFPWLAKTISYRFSNKAFLSPAQRRQCNTQYTTHTQRINQMVTEWTMRTHAREKRLRAYKGNSERQRLLRLVPTQNPWLKRAQHALWLRWLKTQMQAKQRTTLRMSLWKWHIQQLKRARTNDRWAWLKHQYTQLPQALRYEPQRAAMRSYTQLQTAIKQLRRTLGKGQLTQAKRQTQQTLKLWQQWAKQSKQTEVWGLKVDTPSKTIQLWARDLAAMAALQRRARLLSRSGRFKQAEQRRTALAELLNKHPAKQAVLAQHKRQRAKEKTLSALLQRANGAYRKKQWNKARLAFKTYLKRQPTAWNASTLKKQIKACRCAVTLFPFEVCRRNDFPPHFNKKR